MKTKARVRKKETSTAAAFGIGLAAAAAAEFLLLASAATLTSAGVIAEGGMQATAAVCALLCCLIGGLLGAGRTKSLKLPVALGISVVLLAIHAALGRAGAEGSTGMIPLQIAAFPAGGLLAGCLSVRRKKKRR